MPDYDDVADFYQRSAAIATPYDVLASSGSAAARSEAALRRAGLAGMRWHPLRAA